MPERSRKKPSIRAQVITRRTYNRPIENSGTGAFETWDQTVDRVINHQRWLWERAQGSKLSYVQRNELEELRDLMLHREALPAGRTLWLGGTEISRTREASMFNCSFGRIETVHDVVDAFWLLLQGCGVGFEPVVGTLSGFSRPVELEIIRSTRSDRGNPNNVESFVEGVWTIRVGDSAEAWAKAAGKLFANKRMCKRLVVDFSEVRPAGERLKGYGWISSGDAEIAKAFEAIIGILNDNAGKILSRIAILDIINWLGTTLSSRRSAEIALVPYLDPEWETFAMAKKDHFLNNPQRAQSNNSILLYKRPDKSEIQRLFDMMLAAGGSEPGFINAQAALKRAPYFKGVNPCAEILLANKAFCNLTEVDLGRFNGRWNALTKAIRLVARANYRQTCVDLRDGVLQSTWHEQNSFLRLTGVGLTGIVRWEYQDDSEHKQALKGLAIRGANDMADELGMPRSQSVTTIKPSGTLSKIADTTEGIHKPLGKYIFNNVRFSIHDPIVAKLSASGYRVFPDPYSSDAVLATLPVSWEEVEFDQVITPKGTLEVNLESAVSQLERYKSWMRDYVSHNASITVSYDPSEVPEIVEWLYWNWDDFVGVSFLLRNDPTKTAEDLGYPFLPQEVVTREVYEQYVSGLKRFSLDLAETEFEEIIEDDCATGACPIR